LPLNAETCVVSADLRYLKSTLAIFQTALIFQNPASAPPGTKSCSLTNHWGIQPSWITGCNSVEYKKGD